ncbi:aspartate kinase [Paraflavisolibacter sp. H34]|uniref:aspartate kinase n=1 Tax=Huijunlia imazamoxiresistens TaxID=3127457 RepID=UPI0030186EC2
MKVFKFGGASVSTAERIRNVKSILESYREEEVLVVISAMGKTTNALEEVVNAFYRKDKDTALALFAGIKEQHLQLARELADIHMAQLNDLFTEVEWLLHDQPVRAYDYYYDQVVCIGELLSTCIISNYLNETGLKNKWIDVRDVLRTDNNFRDAKIDWEFTNSRVQNAVAPLFDDYTLVITQGFIGATDENESTTLGREGSDYTAAVFANLLDADSQTIWKDVQGVMNADPKLYEGAQWIRELNYREVIEMAYYGAQVIHPKTIKPLQNKEIPLYVKSFLHPQEDGTVIHSSPVNHLPPIIVYKQNQVLIELRTKDFSFVGEGLNAGADEIFSRLKFRPNLTQIAAISLLYVVDDRPEKVDQFAHAAAEWFTVNVRKNLALLTIRHFNNDIYQQLTRNQEIVLLQQTPETVQALMAP